MESTNKVYAVSEEEFVQICENSTSISQINNKLGYTGIGTYTYQLIRERISKLNRPDLEAKFAPRQIRGVHKKKINSLSKEKLEELVENSNTFAECLDKIGVERTNSKNSFHGKVYKTLKETLNKYNIDYTHFSQFTGIKKYTDSCKVDIEHYFSDDTVHGTTAMKKIILRENLIEYKCSCCGNKGEWNGKELSLQLHHINGKRTDNELSNLTFLCPNCHSQTENYCGKNTTNI